MPSPTKAPTGTPLTTQDPSLLVAALSRDQVSLKLDTFDLCCLAGLYLRAGRDGLASFEEALLLDVFGQICDVVEPGAENRRKRATHAIQRLRDQRMLSRIDGVGLVSAGEYTLSRLAASIVEYFLADDALTRESLTLLTRTLLAQLAEVRSAAAAAISDDDWRSNVVGPLRITVGDLVSGIERRQRGLDAAQEKIQADIAGLLQNDWFGAIDEAQDLLDATTATLQELSEVLMRDTHSFSALLQEIHDLAEAADALEAQEATQRVVEQVDRITVWGAARQGAWSNYYQYVHRYLRDVVRLDPDRALSHRLLEQLRSWTEAPFFLVTASEPSIRLLREVNARIERPAVTREQKNREALPEAITESDELDLEALVRASLEAGATCLSEVMDCVLRQLPSRVRFLSAGRVTALVLEAIRAHSDWERPWVRVDEELELEQWRLDPLGTRGRSTGDWL